MNAITIFSDPYVVVTLQSEVNLVRYTRTALRFPDMIDVREHNAVLAKVFETLTPQSLALLVDVRAAPPRNDVEFETEMSRGVAKLMDGFQARAFLVKTAVGGLQIRRLSATRGVPAIATFSDETAALEHLGVK